MKAYGNLMNRIQENAASPVPAVGMGATILMYSDRHAATVVEILSPKRIMIQEDKAIRTDENGMSDSQSYRYEPNPKGRFHPVSLRKDGRWKGIGSNAVVRLGVRDSYHDYSF